MTVQGDILRQKDKACDCKKSDHNKARRCALTIDIVQESGGRVENLSGTYDEPNVDVVKDHDTLTVIVYSWYLRV